MLDVPSVRSVGHTAGTIRPSISAEMAEWDESSDVNDARIASDDCGRRVTYRVPSLVGAQCDVRIHARRP